MTDTLKPRFIQMGSEVERVEIVFLLLVLYGKKNTVILFFF